MKFFLKTYLSHFLVWLGYFLLLFWFYNETSRFEPSLLKSMLITLVQAGVFYLNLHFLLPKYFENRQYTIYGIYILIILVVSLTLFHLFDYFSFKIEIGEVLKNREMGSNPSEIDQAIPREKPPRGGPRVFSDFYWRHILFHGFFIVIVLFLSTIYRNIRVSLQKEKESLELKSRITEAESNMLKSQINPHFLFNTLNNIYSMAQLKSDQTPKAVHRLSELLRYVIYDCNQEFVQLGQEVRYLKSYIELNLMKDENITNISYDLEPIDEHLPIAPMILIPYVENAFKHSHFEDIENSWIKIMLTTTGNRLNFAISNTIPEITKAKDKTSGIGLENVAKRLQLIYPNRHYLNFDKRDGIFKVELIIDLHENELSDR